MDAKDAYARLLNDGSFDDPYISWYPYRWYFAPDGVMCCEPWRGIPRRFEDYRKEAKDEKTKAR